MTLLEKCLQNLKIAASSSQNIMPLMIDAVENYVTVGEISDALREVFGEQKEFSPF